jgi:hypothetical protein
MRCALQAVYGLLAGWLAFTSKPVGAATVQGRVVDSSGRPIAAAEVRLWQKLPQPDGQGISNQPVKFDDGDVLLTDADGRFATPDVLVDEAFARIVAEAGGMLAGRSGWIEIGKDAVAAPDIVLKRLRSIRGKVVDRRGRPVVGATVFNAGDSHERVETMSQDQGAFRLTGMPEGPVFLFAEKPGYRFSGLFSTGEDAVFTLATVDEPVEPIVTLPPRMSDEEEKALGREILEQWLDEVANSGEDAYAPLSALAQLDPVEAYNRADAMRFAQNRRRAFVQFDILRVCIERRALAWDELRTLIESTNENKSGVYVLAARQMGDTEDARRREWLAAALLDARRIDEPDQRARSLALVAQGLSEAGDERAAAELMAEAEKIAEQLPPSKHSGSVFFYLADHVAKHDPDRALAWLDKIEDHNAYAYEAAAVAIRLLPEHPAAAEEAWKRASRHVDGRRRPIQLALRSIQTANLCYGMAGVDPSRAERLARAAEAEPLRLRGLGAAALRLAESDPAAAKKLLEGTLRGELPQAAVDGDFKAFGHLLAAPITAAWLLPIAERIDPQLGRECFWRSLALRPPRTRRDKLDDEEAAEDIALAMMLGRYDREVARGLLVPLVARLPELARCGSTDLRSRHAHLASAPASNEASEILAAALHIDARWSAELFKGLLVGESEPQGRFRAWVRNDYVSTLVRHADRRWGEAGHFSRFSANYWTPRDEATSRASTQAD